MINISKKEECCGCHSCSNICPKECISMKVDNEGFWYPKVDSSKCIDCGLCEKVCPTINIFKLQEKDIEAYVCKNKNEEIRMNSSSGGVFTILCEKVIDDGGVIFGSAFDNEFNVYHTYGETLDECSKFRGSKYVQSKIGETYKKAKEFLEAGRVVLFSGTPCQISGLDSYLRKKYENLILVDIACHGVPSPLIYGQYINNVKKLNKSEIKDIKFRDKSTGWEGYSFKIRLEDCTLKEKGYENTYMKGFLKDIYLRPSCYVCKFKKPITSADLTLADYWGVRNKHPKLYDDKGISLVLVNSKKGHDFFELISSKMVLSKTDFKYAANCNPCIVRHVKYNLKREKFFKEVNENNIEEIIDKYTRVPFYKKLKGKANNALSRIKRILMKGKR